MRSTSEVTYISPAAGSKFSFSELWLYRELFYFFAWRDIKVRYKQTAIGAGWAILQPLIATIIFSIIFNRIVGIESHGVPYPVFAFVGLMYWFLFSSGMNSISNSLISNQGVITKIYFPRLIPPFSAAFVAVIDFFFSGVVFIGLLAFFKVVPNLVLGSVAALGALLLMVTFTLGLGTFLAAVNVKYRDVKAALPFLIQIMMYASPIIYPIELIPEQYRLWAYLNPAAGAVSMVRAGLFGAEFDFWGILLSIVVSIALLVFAVWYFKRSEKGMADII